MEEMSSRKKSYSGSLLWRRRNLTVKRRRVQFLGTAALMLAVPALQGARADCTGPSNQETLRVKGQPG